MNQQHMSNKPSLHTLCTVVLVLTMCCSQGKEFLTQQLPVRLNRAMQVQQTALNESCCNTMVCAGSVFRRTNKGCALTHHGMRIISGTKIWQCVESWIGEAPFSFSLALLSSSRLTEGRGEARCCLSSGTSSSESEVPHAEEYMDFGDACDSSSSSLPSPCSCQASIQVFKHQSLVTAS